MRRPRPLWAMILVVLLADLPGCKPTRAGPHPVDSGKAREQLHGALERWKAGETVGMLKQSQPAVYVQDMDWDQGLGLLDFQLDEEGKSETARWYCSVRLTVRSKIGRPMKKTVKYGVTTSPKITIFRQMFQ